MDELTAERAYCLHCRGKTVPQIAKRLRLTDDEARALIVDRWREDRESGGEDDHLRYE